MIITADESIIDQIERSNDASLLTQIVLESAAENSTSIRQQVDDALFLYWKEYSMLLDQGKSCTTEEYN